MPSRIRLSSIIVAAFVALLATFPAADTRAETIARCGKGWLETIDGYPVLHLKGSPREMGYQHGVLLRDKVKANLTGVIKARANVALVEIGPLAIKPAMAIRMIVEIQRRHIPPKYFAEMEGLAAGSGLALDDVRMTNFIPEMFHCSGFALLKSATTDGGVLHGRVLDYATDWGLQDHAILIVAEPDDGIPFVNVTYAGFIGSVTGMNAKHVSIGEMGGGGLGHWDGVPMALLVREALEQGKDLDAAIAVFRDHPRTCQYFYVLADGASGRAVGMEASWNKFTLVEPGSQHPLLPTPVADCALLSAGDRYNELVRRTQAGHGKFTPESALRLMDRGVAMRSNLHNVLFQPGTTKFWVANASPDGQPAADQKYQAFQLSELLARRPDPASPQLAAH